MDATNRSIAPWPVTEDQGAEPGPGMTRPGRRRYWVNPRLQLPYIAAIVGVEALALAVLAWAMFVVVWQPLLSNVRTDNVPSTHSPDGATPPASRETLAAAVRQVTITTLALFVVFGAVCAAVGLVVSHSVAGPLVRLKQAVHTAVVEDRFDHRVRLRRGDSLHDVADEVNLLLGHLEARQRQERELLDRVAAAITNVTQALRRGEAVPEDVLEQTQDLEGLVHRAAVRP